MNFITTFSPLFGRFMTAGACLRESRGPGELVRATKIEERMKNEIENGGKKRIRGGGGFVYYCSR